MMQYEILKITQKLTPYAEYKTREFHKYTSSSPKEYLIQLRINEAKRLLKATNNSIDMIASQVSFSDTAHFIQIFKKREG